MNYKYKKILLMSLIMVIMVVSASCSNQKVDDDKITIVTTLFPQYDFAKQIVGDKCEVILLLPPGTDSHSYEPTPRDIINISEADMFIYTGDIMEAWAQTILDAVDNEDLKVVDVSKDIELLETGEVLHEHNHNEEFEEDEHEHSHEHSHEHEESEDGFGHSHSHDIDPHFFTSPHNAMIMMNTILKEVVELDGDNEDYYVKNYETYLKELEAVDERLHEICESAENKTLYFGGKFAMLYFVNDYHLSYVSPFASCAHESEADPKSIVDIIECMNEHDAKAVFYEELADPKVAKIIAEEVDGETYLLHSCHNVSKDDLEKGVTYVDLMNQNADNLEKGLK